MYTRFASGTVLFLDEELVLSQYEPVFFPEEPVLLYEYSICCRAEMLIGGDRLPSLSPALSHVLLFPHRQVLLYTLCCCVQPCKEH
jgi:hypothetical protein